MSEEKRFTNKKLIAVSIVLVLVSGMTGVLGFTLVGVLNDNTTLSGNYDDLYIDHLELLYDFNTLDNQYFILTGEHIELENDYNALVIALADMTDERDALDSALIDMTTQRDVLESALTDMTLERDNLLTQIEILNAEISTHLTTIFNLNTQINNLDTQIITLENTINDLEINIFILDVEIIGYLSTIADLNAQIDLLEGQAIVDDETIADLNTQITTLTNDLTVMTVERDNLLNNLDDMTTERDNLLNQIDILDAEITGYLATISGLEVTVTANELEITDLNSQVNILTIERDILIIDLADMTLERDDLQSELDVLQLEYNNLLGDYQILSDANIALQNTYDALLIAYDYICSTIRQSILPVQYSIFAEAVRRYYMDIYLEGLFELDEKEYWIAFAEFCRDIILHDSWQYNSFTEVSNAFSDALTYGSATMLLVDYIMYWTFYPWLPNWDGFALTGNELTDINTIVDWCIDEIDYEYDSEITRGQETFDWDYIKFPVETAFRTMGDCEDQAILAATYLESCGFETVIIISHDPAHPTLGAFYHGHLMVHIEDTITYNTLYSAPLWNIPYDPYEGYTWAWLDTTWDVPFGSTPTWLSDYGGSIGTDIMTIAFCDIDGSIGKNTGLTCVMPT